MPKVLLDDNFAKRVQRPSQGCVEYSDTKLGGSYEVRVYADRIVGTYRGKLLGSTKRPRVPVGEHPNITMAVMRKNAEAARARFKAGGDPTAEREAIKAERRKAEAQLDFTIAKLIDAFEPELKTRKATWDQDVAHLNRDVRSRWADRSPASITKADCAALLAEVKARTASGANYVRLVMIALFGWAVEQGHIAASPMDGIPRPTKKKKGANKRALDDAELVVMWRAIEKAKLAPGLLGAFQALILTGQRANEIAGLALAEIYHLDDERQARVEFPAERMKARRPHILPLSPPVIAIIREQLDRQAEDARLTGRNSLPDHIFESRFYDRTRIARHSLSQAMRRIIDGLDESGGDAAVVKRLKADRPTPHAFRRSLVTGLARLGVSREDRKAVVAHAEDDVLEQSYDSFDRLPQKRIALILWADHVHALLTGKKSTGAVVQFPTRA